MIIPQSGLIWRENDGQGMCANASRDTQPCPSVQIHTPPVTGRTTIAQRLPLRQEADRNDGS